MAKKPKVVLTDIQPLNDNLVPLWLILRALIRLGVIKPETFREAVEAEVKEELNRYGTPEKEFENQLERVLQLIAYNLDP